MLDIWLIKSNNLQGVPRDFSFVRQNQLDEQHPNCIFINLDDDLQALNFKASGELPLAWSTNLTIKLKPYFSSLLALNPNASANRLSSSSPKKNLTGRSKTPTKQTQQNDSKSKYLSVVDERDVCYKICSTIHDFMHKEILQHIPMDKKYLNGKVKLKDSKKQFFIKAKTFLSNI